MYFLIQVYKCIQVPVLLVRASSYSSIANIASSSIAYEIHLAIIRTHTFIPTYII